MNNQQPRKAAPKGSAKKSKKASSKKNKGTVKGSSALGTNAQGPLMLKTEQFATYAPLQTFSIAAGSTPGGVRVRGRELLAALNSGSSAAGAFGANNATSAGTVNLLPASFPRLTSFGSIYEFYLFHNFKAMFQSTRPTTAQGVCELAVDYDFKDTAPTTTIGMMRNISSSMSNIYADNACAGTGKLSRLPKFVCAEDSSSDSDQVNQAKVLYAFEGLASTEVNTPQGYLVIEYDVEFFTPQ